MIHFNPRSPCGERPGVSVQRRSQVVISIHALLAESDHPRAHHSGRKRISIHALLAESDKLDRSLDDAGNISIHALLAESDFVRCVQLASQIDFNPRSPCGERRIQSYQEPYECTISIHALLAESDDISGPAHRGWGGFQSTLSLRRATARETSRGDGERISIHALLAESDRRL